MNTEVRPAGVTRQEFRRKQREAARPKTNVPIIHLVDCPACNKRRHTKYQDDDGNVPTVSTETIVVRGETRFVDVCQYCVFKYRSTDERFIMSNLKKLQRAAANRDGTTSDKDFTIDL
jgi:hypothetical protein